MEIDPSVFVSHFKSILQNDSSLQFEDKILIELIVQTVESNFHPLSVVSDEAIARFLHISKINLSTLSLKGIPTPEPKTSVVKKSKTKKLSVEELIDAVNKAIPSEVVACKNYSCADNCSKDYPYANSVDMPTCSHKTPPHGLYCPYGLNQNACSFYSPDVDIETFIVDDVSYTIKYERTIQAKMNIYMTDSFGNLIHKLSYFIDKFNEIDSDTLHQEFSSILTNYHSALSSKDDIQFQQFVKNTESSDSKKSYISTLIS